MRNASFNFSILGLLRSTVAKRLLILLKLYVRKEASLLLERRVEELCNIIPLSTAKQNISMSFKYLLDALNEISEIGFVENYEIIKNDRVINYIIKINVFEKTIEENLIWLLKKVRFEKKIPITSKKEKNEYLLKMEIQNIANELRNLIRDIENILKECDIENRYIIKDILLSMIEKVHAIKGIAKYIYNYEIYDLANEEEKKIVGYLKSKVEIKTSLLRDMLIFTNKVSEEVENEDIDS